MQLWIGNKNYSSWSLRPWLLMTHTGSAFDAVKLRLGFAPDSEFKRRLAAVSPAGRVRGPVRCAPRGTAASPRCAAVVR